MAIGNVSAKECAMIAIKRTEHDFIAFNGGSTTSTTFVNVVDLTFTPATTGDYLLVAQGAVTKTTVSSNVGIQLYDSSFDVAYGDSEKRVSRANTHYMPWSTVKKISLTGGVSRTFNIRIKSVTSGTSTLWYGGIVALRLDLFPRVYHTNDANRSTTTAQTYQNKLTLNIARADAQPFLILSQAFTDGASTTSSTLAQVTKDGSTLFETTNEPDVVTTADYMVPIVRRQVLTGDDVSYKLDYKSEAGSTAGIAETALTAIQLKDNANVWIKGLTNIFGASIL